MKNLLIVLILLLSAILPVLPADIFSMPVYAAGISTCNITGTGYYMEETTPRAAFDVMSVSPSADTVSSGSLTAGWRTWTISNQFDVIRRSALRFDLSTLPAGVDIKAITIYVQDQADQLYWTGDYWSYYRFIVAGSTPTNAEWSYIKNHKDLVTAPKAQSTLSGLTWRSWPVYTGDWDYILTPQSGNYTWVGVGSLWELYNVDPGWQSFKQHFYTSSNFYLQISYVTPAATRTMEYPTNAADYTGVITGNETITGIDWLTPRAAFSDETLGFRIVGYPGAAFDMSLVSENNGVIATSNNTIKDNNYYYWNNITLPSDLNDWVRCVAVSDYGDTVQSTWGRVELTPSDTQRNLSVSAVSTEYPQFEYNFSDYVKHYNSVNKVYWQTNMVSGDLASYELKILAKGQTDIFSETPAWINTNVYQHVYSNNNDMVHWRYLFYTPYINTPGFNSYDGFILNIGKIYSASYSGFWQTAIRGLTDVPLTYTDSAYFYLDDPAKGVIISIPDTTVGLSDEVTANIYVGSQSAVSDYLSNLTIDIISAENELMASSEHSIFDGDNTIVFISPDTAGEYQARFTFYDTASVPDYSYIKDLHFTVTETGGEPIPAGSTPSMPNVKAWFFDLLGRWGLDNTGGHYFLLFLLCIFWALFVGWYCKMHLVATGLVVLTIIAGVYVDWIDKWVLALVAIGVGFIVYGIFRKKTTGTGSEGVG